MAVPFLNLVTHHQALKGEILGAIEGVIDSNAFANGCYVDRFEADFAGFCGVEEAVGVGSGTEALWLTLLAFGIGRGDEVITVPNTFIATAEAISLTGAAPRFVDVDEGTYTMDPQRLEEAITARTKAVVPVHLYGQMADMEAIVTVARQHGLLVVEDAAQAHGATYRGRKAGSIGHAGCFSFYPSKNLGAFGEAGAVVTDDPNLGARIRMLRDHGQARKYRHEVIGWNSRMDSIQAVVLKEKLKYLDRMTSTRRAYASIYGDYLKQVTDIRVPGEASDRKHVYYVYVIRVRGRDEVLEELRRRGIACAIHYPVPLHLQEAYRHLGYSEGRFPIVEHSARELLSLPMCPGLTEEQIRTAAAEVADIVTKKGRKRGSSAG